MLRGIETSFLMSSFFGGAGILSGGETGDGIGTTVAGAAITVPRVAVQPVLHPTEAEQCGATWASHERRPWNRPRSLSSSPCFWHGSLQLVVKPVKTGRLMSGAPQHLGIGAQAGAQVATGTEHGEAQQ